MRRLSNIPLLRYRAALSALGLRRLRTKGDHEMWARDGMVRSAVFQSGEDPVPEGIVVGNLKSGVSREEFVKLLDEL